MEEPSAQEQAEVVEIAKEIVTEESGGGESVPVEGAEAEQSPVEEPAPPAEDPAFSRRFASLAKRDRALRGRENELKDLRAEVAKLRGNPNEYKDLAQLAKDNPAEAMERLGISYQQLTEQVLNEGTLTDEFKLKRENAALSDRVQQLEEARAEQEASKASTKYEKAYGNFLDDIKKFTENDGSFELVQTRDAYPLVAEVMQEHYNRHNEVMDYSKALGLVEAHFESEAQSYLGSKKLEKQLRERFSPATPEAEASQESAPPGAVAPSADTGPKTLTNGHSAQSAERQTGLLSRQESLNHIARMLEGAV